MPQPEQHILRQEIAALYREVGARGLNVGSSGNVSARFGAGMLITPSGIAGGHVTPECLVEIDFAGAGESGASSEWQMHAEIYRAAPEAMVILHTHSDHATALACLNLPLPPFHYDVVGFGGDDVRVAPYTVFGSPELAHAAAAAISGRTACLLANHGMICHGRDAAGALLTALRLEALARQYLLARAAGTPRLLNQAEIEAARARYRSYAKDRRTP
jgi:L-fuculose-phosphate aldolase